MEKKLKFLTKKTISDAVIFIDDNGPGIPERRISECHETIL